MKRTLNKLLALLLAALFTLSLGGAALAAPAAEAAVSVAEYDAADAVSFVFSDTGITPGGGDGYEIDGTALKITASGTYILSGSCSDGSVTVKKGTTGVTLVLDGLTLTSSDTAPICCNKSTEVTIVAAVGSVNTLTDSARNNDETYPDNLNAENAVIKAKDGAKLTLCGSGTLNINANGKNGVKGGLTTETEGEASLTVKDLTLNITANVNDALKSDQLLNIESGILTIAAADDAISSDYVLNIGAEGTAGPTILITRSVEGIEAATLNIWSGSITVHATDDGINAANGDLVDYSYEFNLYGGTVYIDVSAGDGIDSNGTLNLAGGTLEIYTPGQGDGSPLDCDGVYTLGSATILAVGTGEMAQTPNSTTQAYVTYGAGGMMGGFGGPNMGGQNQTGVSINAGDSISVQDESGNTLYTGKAMRTASYVFFTSPELSEGASYTLSLNGAAAATATAAAQGGTGFGPGMGGGQMPGGENQPGQPGDGNQPPEPPSDGQFPGGGTQLPEPPADGQFPGGQFPGDGNQPPEPPGQVFTDVAPTDWYSEAVDWAVGQSITTGTTVNTFTPKRTCTVKEILTFLWRAAGQPEPTIANPFTNLDESAYYAKAAIWAYEQGMVSGAEFAGDEPCTRAMTVTFLWQYAGSPAAEGETFTDVSADADYAVAVAWAVNAGVTNGTGDGLFSPDKTCNRAEIVTFLYRAFAK